MSICLVGKGGDLGGEGETLLRTELHRSFLYSPSSSAEPNGDGNPRCKPTRLHGEVCAAFNV